MLNHAATPTAADCDTKGLSTTRELGEKLRVDSTPTMFLRNGQRVTGALPKDRLEQLLAGAQAADHREKDSKTASTK